MSGRPPAGSPPDGSGPEHEPEHEPGRAPSRDALRRFVAASPRPVGKREVARAFGLGATERAVVRDLLKELERDGSLDNLAGSARPRGEQVAGRTGRLPESMVVQVTGTDSGGDAVARPANWAGPGAPPPIVMHPEPKGRPALAPGQRVLARLRPIGGGRYEGRTLRRIEAQGGRVLGVFRPAPSPPADDVPYRRGRVAEAGRVVPTDRRVRADWTVPPGETGAAEPDELVLAEPLPQVGSDRGLGLKPVRVLERLGRMGEARSVSLLCLHMHDIPQEFPPAALVEAEAAVAVGPDRRTDLRAVPLVTIDGTDARDFDDAVHAEPDGDNGWRLLVAIADVAHYVRPGSALDGEARRRGNSVYFPDRVVPMLPEALSNGWCSLKPGEPRGCLFAEMRIDNGGALRSQRFGRGLMRSAARLTYEQVQEAADNGHDDAALALPSGLLRSLYDAFGALLAARRRRGTLELDLPERQVRLTAEGAVAAIVPRPRLDSHRLIEEFMVLANVAAATELERLGQPCLYRVHAPPAPERLDALRTMLATLDIPLKPAGEVRPADLDRVLGEVAGTAAAELVNETVLRAQSQAEYSPDNVGHFGLALPRYAHFTSPIRRYADLLVHRALIAGLGLGPDGLRPQPVSNFADAFADTGAHVTATERRAALAERDALERYIAAHMSDKIGTGFAARISGVTRFGLFVTLLDTGATGLVPISSLNDLAPVAGATEFWMHDEAAQALVGQRSRGTFRLAQRVEVRLVEAAPLTGGLLFAMLSPPTPPDPAAVHDLPGPVTRRRPAGGRGKPGP